MPFNNRTSRYSTAAAQELREKELAEKRKQRIKEDAADAPESTPKQSERPSKRAQWDELKAAWVEWDAASNDWKVVGETDQ